MDWHTSNIEPARVSNTQSTTYPSSDSHAFDAIPQGGLAVLDALEHAGYEAWIVGGFVRDTLLGRDVHDVDIATNALWQEVQYVCEAAGFSTIETGTAHGTLTVQAEDSSIEVTTFRSDGNYTDARHPDAVSFVSTIEEDLARRDFTINAMAFHPACGLVDPYGGAADLRAGVVRAVGEPRERFAEDALRILRAVRFASELGFTLDASTLEGANNQASTLNKVSAERIFAELTRLLCGQGVQEALCAYPRIIDTALPELAPMRGFDQKSPYHIYDVYDHTARVVAGVETTPLLRWSALLHDCAKPACFTVGENGQGHFFGHAKAGTELAEHILKRLKAPLQLTREVCLLVLYHDTHRPPTPKGVRRMLHNLHDSPRLFHALCALQCADAHAHAPGYTSRADLAMEAERMLDRILEEGAAFSLKQLAVHGNDLVELGIPEGPRVGHMLQAALDAVIDEHIPNTREAILEFLEGESH